MTKRPKIMLCNDDGIQGPGLVALWEALVEADFADIVIIAPLHDRSGAGVSLTWDRPLLIQPYPWTDHTPAWAVDGTPADCVKMAARVILDAPIDLILSGINAGSNAGRNVLHSGTIGAVIEGIFRGIPGAALSCENGQTPNYHVAKKYVARIVKYMFAHPLVAGSFLNVNFPHAAQEEVKGFKLTHQGKGRWTEDPILHLESHHGPSYWLGGKPEEFVEDPDCDISWLQQGYMTAVPIHIHELTDQKALRERKKAFEEGL